MSISDGDSIGRARAAVEAMFRDDHASKSLGMEILEVAPGRARVAMTVREDMLNGVGICHGGLLFALADSAFAFACNSRGAPMVAAGASIEFLAPAARGERVTATAVELSRSERGGLYDVAVTAASGAALAHFRGRCARYRGAAGGAGGEAGAAGKARVDTGAEAAAAGTASVGAGADSPEHRGQQR